MKTNNFNRLLLALLVSASIVSCRKDEAPVPEQKQELTADPSSVIKGLFVANEGNMNSNKASVDYLDFRAGVYRKNIYNTANPEVVNGLGDVANDVAVYGSKLYVVVNASNKVEVMDVKTGKRISQINITNCRYITFHNGKGYVSAYLGGVGESVANGIVAEIDTAGLNEIQRINVGRQPEQMAVVGDKLYVANSGGYSSPDYERTVSVINLNSFTFLKNIDVDINLHLMKLDKYGDLYVTARGNYADITPKLYVINTQTDVVKKSFDLVVSDFVIDDDYAYFYGSSYNYTTGKSDLTFGVLNIKDEVLTDRKYITDGTESSIMAPYGITINPYTKDVFLADATDYSSPGWLYCFNSSGKMKYKLETGDIPGHFAFFY
ncbi:YncE family protein [Pedobacter sp. AW31-3R]|uniref:YncE family protein n=1 Tax=Pedobacter sp. AW31-3R TaxID=3445781 RepID=UPI003FA13F18